MFKSCPYSPNLREVLFYVLVWGFISIILLPAVEIFLLESLCRRSEIAISKYFMILNNRIVRVFKNIV